MRAARAEEDGDAAAAARATKEATRLHEAAAAAGSADAMLNAGVLRHRAGDLVGAAALWRRAASLGQQSAMRHLSRALFQGEGVARDPAAATRWLAKAARRGDGAAMYRAARY